MAKFRVLILDDEVERVLKSQTQDEKGYGLIEDWFPGVFDVTTATYYYESGGAALLYEREFDLLLLDVNFKGDAVDGFYVLSHVRRGDHFHDLPNTQLNRGVWVIGCSYSWPKYFVGFTSTGFHQLDGRAENAVQLRHELARFLDLHRKK